MLTDRQLQDLLADGIGRHAESKGQSPTEAQAAAAFVRDKGGLIQQIRAGRKYLVLSPPRLLDHRRLQKALAAAFDAGRPAPLILDLLMGIELFERDPEFVERVNIAELFRS